MSERNIDQHSVLTWVWHVAKKYENDEDGIQLFREHVRTIMGNIAKTGAIDFDNLLREFKRGLY